MASGSAQLRVLRRLSARSFACAVSNYIVLVLECQPQAALIFWVGAVRGAQLSHPQHVARRRAVALQCLGAGRVNRETGFVSCGHENWPEWFTDVFTPWVVRCIDLAAVRRHYQELPECLSFQAEIQNN